MAESRDDERDVLHVRIIARLADMLEYACWDYPDDATEAKQLVQEADRWLSVYRKAKEK